MIAITGEKDSTLGKYSDVVCAWASLMKHVRLVSPERFDDVYAALGDALAFTVMKARNFSVEDYVGSIPAARWEQN